MHLSTVMIDYPQTLFHQQILQKCLKYGHDVALTDDYGEVTFRQVFQQSYQMAILLDSMNIVTGESILVIIPNSTWYPIVFLGAALIGCPISGISTDSTAEEVQYYARKSEAKAAICNDKNYSKLHGLIPLEKIIVFCSTEEYSDFAGSILLPRDMAPWHDSLPNMFEDISIQFDDPLLMPFSSGTGGQPHCVKLSHRNYSAATAILKEALFDKLVEESRRKTIAVLPFYHASGFWALLYSLLERCHTIIMRSFHPIAMLENIQKYEIDTLNVVPAIMSFLCRVDTDNFDLSCVRTVLCGSSPLGKKLCNLFLRKFPSVQNLVQGYGMTEIVVLSHITPLGDLDETRLGSCGMLLPGFEAELRDETGQIIEGPNHPGELYLKSPTVMLGYHRPDKDHTDVLTDGWLRTGDVLYYDDDGYWFVVDRVKDLIKVNGVQVSPSELEEVLLMDPHVHEVGVVGVNHPDSGQVPKAFVTLVDGADEEEAKKSIMRLVKARVAPAKLLRGGIEIVKELPKTSSGKVKRGALRLLSQQGSLAECGESSL